MEKFYIFPSAWGIVIRLKDMDKKILCALVKYPNRSYGEIANVLDMNYWTFYKGVEKLKNLGLFKEKIIPNFPALGFELLVVGYGSLTKRRMYSLEKLKNMRNYLPFASGIFYAFAESYRGFVLGVAKNFTEISKSLIFAERLVNVREILMGENTNMVLLPFEITEIPIFFDYSNLLSQDFNIHLEELPEKRKEMRKIGRREMNILIEMVKKPSVSIKDISKSLKMAQQSVSKIRKRLFEEGWVRKIIIPNIKKLGYEVLVFAHWNSKPEVMEKIERINPENFGFETSNVVFAAYNPLEGVAIAPFKTLKESREIVAFFEKFGETTGVLTREPNILFLSLQEGIKIRDHEYQSALISS